MALCHKTDVLSDLPVADRLRGMAVELQQGLENQISIGKIPAAYFLCSVGTELIEEKSIGRLGDGSIITGNTAFPLYSMTKLATTLLFLSLCRRRVFSLNDKLESYLPQFRDQTVLRSDGRAISRANPILLRHLLMHTSGIDGSGFGRNEINEACRIAGLYDLAAYGGKRKISVSEYISLISNIPLSFHPGTYWRYSRSHDVIGCLIACALKTPLQQVFQTNLFDPLDLKNTAFAAESSGAASVSDLGTDLFVSAGSGLCSSAYDYLKLCSMFTHLRVRDDGLAPDSDLFEAELFLDFPIGDDPIEFPGLGWGFGPGFGARCAQRGTTLGWLSRLGSCFAINTHSGAIAILFLTATTKTNREYFKWLGEVFLRWHP